MALKSGRYMKGLDFAHPAAALLREKAGAYCAAVVRRLDTPGCGSGDARRELYAAAIAFAAAWRHRKTPRRAKKERDDREFRKGFALAVADVARQDNDSMARDIVRQAALKFDFWHGLGLTVFDTSHLRRALRRHG